MFMGDALKRNVLNVGRFALTGLAAAVMTLTSSQALALGLGRLAVQSSLGDTLRAEIDVTSMTPEEAANLRVRIAPPESYRAAGVDYNAVLPGTQAVLSRRADGRPYLRLTSDRAVQEPFVDVILELTWSSGRLVREYTLLFDPPNSRNTAAAPSAAVPAAASPMPAAAPAAAPVAAAPVPAPTPAPPAPLAAAAKPAPASPPPAAAPAAAPKPAPLPPSAAAQPAAEAKKSTNAGADEYKVRAGDSLSRIATQTQRSGVSLDQMLVSLYRGNPQAFMDNNMNRLKSGVVLAVPSAEAAKGISQADAKQVIQAQSLDFGAYRQRLASGVPEAKVEGSARQATGKVQSAVEDKKAAATPTPDKLTLSKGAAAAKASAAEDKISKEKETKDAADRVAELSRNVEALKKISGASAASAAASAAAKAATTVAAAPVAPPAPAASVPAVVVPVPVPAVPPPPAPVVAAAPTPVPAIAASAPVPAKVVESAPPKDAASAAVAAASRADPAPVEGSGLMGTLLEDNPLALAAGSGLLAALLGFGVYKLRRRSKSESGETSFLESRLQPDSFFGASGGQRIDTREPTGSSSSMSYSLSQLDAIGDVDPVAEADVYLAYGRDLQAEEILKEAMRSTPERLAIRTKLLEVYAKRRDIKGFESLAIQLFGLTRGEGTDWARAQELGQQVDPDNALYQLGGVPTSFTGEDDRVEPLGASTMPQSVLPSPSQFGPDAARASAQAANLNMDLDLDLDFSDSLAPASASMPTIPATMRPDPFGDSVSFANTQVPSAKSTSQGLAGAGAGLAASAAAGVAALGATARSSASAASLDAPMTFDLSSISLDFDAPADDAVKKRISPITVPGQLQMPAAVADRGSDSVHDSLLDSAYDSTHENADPLLRKLELAEEFRQIGDTDGARDLLHEVLAKANGTLKTRAQGILDQLG
jgi:pilus assembly protein FimV